MNYRQQPNRKSDGSGYFKEGSKWWAVIRETTINVLQGTYETEAEAKENYEAWQHKWDTERLSSAKWKKGKNCYGDS